MKQSGKVVDLRKGSPRNQPPLFSWRLPGRDKGEPPQKRPTPIRVKRRKARTIAALVLLVGSLGALWGIHQVSYLEQFSIDSISIVGAREIPTELLHTNVTQILDSNGNTLFSRRNIFLFPRSLIERSVAALSPHIKSVAVTRESLLATSITVTIKERQAFAKWCGEDCYRMDDTGFIFAGSSPDDSTSIAKYAFRGGIASSSNPIGQQFAAERFAYIVSLFELLESKFDPLEGRAENNQDFFVTLKEGFVLKTSFGQDAHTLMKNLELVLSSEPLKGKERQIEYIDLRFDNRVYYKLRGDVP